MSTETLGHVTRELAFYAWQMAANIGSKSAYEFWRAKFYAARDMAYICTGIEFSVTDSDVHIACIGYEINGDYKQANYYF